MSNLPPGVTSGMIPGNTPEDEAWENFHEEIDGDTSDERLDALDAKKAWIVGLHAFKVISAYQEEINKPAFEELQQRITDLQDDLKNMWLAIKSHRDRRASEDDVGTSALDALIEDLSHSPSIMDVVR